MSILKRTYQQSLHKRTSAKHSLHVPLLPPAGGPGNFIYMQLTDSDLPSKTGEEGDEEEKVARLASLPITAPDTDLCMSFWYHMFGEHAGALHIKQRKEAEAGHILWTLSGHQGRRWREGRVLLPHASVPYQVNLSIVSQEGRSTSISLERFKIHVDVLVFFFLHKRDIKDTIKPQI